MPWDDERTEAERAADDEREATKKAAAWERFRTSPPAPTRDLEVLATLLEIAAIELTPKPGTVFTLEALLAKTHEFAEPEMVLLDEDLRAALEGGSVSGVQRVDGGYELC